MPRIEIPDYRSEPEPVWVRCAQIREPEKLKPLKEVLVQLIIHGEKYVGFAPEWSINRNDNSIQGAIYADVNGGVLINVPTDTFTGGSRFFVRDSERESLLSPRQCGSV